MGFVTALLVSLALTIVGELLRPKQKPQNAKASGLDDFSIPTAEEGRAIPVFCGKVKIDGSNVTAYGDLEAVPLTQKVKTGLFSSTRQTYAHRYMLGMQMVLGWGGDVEADVHEVWFGDAMPRHTRTDEGNGCIRFDFDDESFYGGDKEEGGVKGTMRFYKGTESQTANAYLATLVGETVPAYKRLMYAVLEKMYIGTSEYIKTVSYVVSRYPNQLGLTGGKHKIGDDANPICFVYEIVTDPIWGVGLPGSDIDDEAWVSAAEKIYDEGYGMSMIYNGGSAAKEIISDVLRHVDGVMFSDPETGLLSLRLARGDYDIDDLPVYGPSDFQDGIDFTRPSWGETKNVVRGTYVDRNEGYKVVPVTHQDLANLMTRNGEIALEEIDFTGFSSWDACSLAVARALKTLSYPLAKVSGPLSRRAWRLKPADVFVLNWPNLGIAGVVFRVIRVRRGGLEDNTISIEAVEDIFSVEESGYVQPPPSGWVDPLGPVQPLYRQSIAGLPYPMMPQEGETIATYGTRMAGLDQGYVITSDRGPGGFETRSTATTFTPSGQLASSWPATAAAIEADGPELTNVRMSAQIENSAASMPGGAGIARVVSGAGEEWIAYASLDTNLRQVWRGIFDTPPIDHPAGAVVWFASSGFDVENDTPYSAAATVDVKLLPYNARGTLDPADATTMTLTTSNRGSRPLPPGRVRVGGVHPLSVSGTTAGTFALAWVARSRMSPVLQSQDDLGATPEDGTTYVVEARREDTNALLATGEGNLPTASVTLNYTGDIRINIFAKLNGLLSHRPQTFVLDYDGTGVSTSVVTVDSAEYILDGGGA